VQAALPEHTTGKPIEIWFADEARVGQQGTLTQIWARRGAICPERATGAGLVLPLVNAEAMNLHLQEISRHVASGAHAVLVLDRAGWHGAAALTIPDNLSLLPLPSYSPELNPVENVWEYLRQNRICCVGR
jgi:hypothetical protein